MNPIDILGAILGKKSQSKGSNGRGLRDVLGRGGDAPQSQPEPDEYRGVSTADTARRLEDLLNVANDRHTQRREHREPTREIPREVPREIPRGTSREPRYESPAARAQLPGRESDYGRTEEELSAEAIVLIRAMVQASKSDGQIDQEEQGDIVKRLGKDVTQDEIDFIRKEFDRPLDARETAWAIPLGLEEQAYGASLMAIDLDEQKEATYLGELAHGLRLTPRRCNELHRRFKAPEIFRDE